MDWSGYFDYNSGKYVNWEGKGDINTFFKNIYGAVSGTSAAMVQAYNQRELQKDQQAFNSAEAQKERDYQTEMSNTAHQREVADLQAAGLNPWLSAGGGSGATSAAGASATSSQGSASMAPNQIGNALMAGAISAGALVKLIAKLAK